MTCSINGDIANGDGSRFRLFHRFMLRSNVVLPEPLGPIIAILRQALPRGRYRAAPSDREIFHQVLNFNGTHFGSLSWRLSDSQNGSATSIILSP